MADQVPNPPSPEAGATGADVSADANDSDFLGLDGTGLDEGSDQGQGVPPGGEEFAALPENATASERQAHARMQAAFTKKTQAVATRLRDLEARETRLNAESAQQEGLRRLLPYLRDPRTQKFLYDTFEGGGGSEVGADGDSELDPVVAQAVRKHTDPLASQLRNLQEQIVDQHALASFVGEHPDWQKHHEGMKRAWQKDAALGRPLRSREDAYNAAIVEQVRQARERRAAADARNRAGVGGAGSTSSVPKSTERPMFDMRDASRAALEEAGFRPDEVLGRRDL